jgi:hypothetical protein
MKNPDFDPRTDAVGFTGPGYWTEQYNRPTTAERVRALLPMRRTVPVPLTRPSVDPAMLEQWAGLGWLTSESDQIETGTPQITVQPEPLGDWAQSIERAFEDAYWRALLQDAPSHPRRHVWADPASNRPVRSAFDVRRVERNGDRLSELTVRAAQPAVRARARPPTRAAGRVRPCRQGHRSHVDRSYRRRGRQSARRLRRAPPGEGLFQGRLRGRHLALIGALIGDVEPYTESEMTIAWPDEAGRTAHLFGAMSTEPAAFGQVTEWYSRLVGLEFHYDKSGGMPVPYAHPEDGCYLRAHLMALKLIQWGAPVRKVIVTRTDPQLVTWSHNAAGATNALPLPVQWIYHIAPAVPTRLPDGTESLIVLDPALERGPLSESDWLTWIGVTPDQINEHLTGPLEAVHLTMVMDWLIQPERWFVDGADYAYPTDRTVVVVTEAHAGGFPSPTLQPPAAGCGFVVVGAACRGCARRPAGGPPGRRRVRHRSVGDGRTASAPGWGPAACDEVAFGGRRRAAVQVQRQGPGGDLPRRPAPQHVPARPAGPARCPAVTPGACSTWSAPLAASTPGTTPSTVWRPSARWTTCDRPTTRSVCRACGPQGRLPGALVFGREREAFRYGLTHWGEYGSLPPDQQVSLRNYTGNPMRTPSLPYTPSHVEINAYGEILTPDDEIPADIVEI